jgi:hypothetical protein
MAGVPLKFRCYQCNQLLGVSRSKAGSVLACPKCGAELVVPQPAESAATTPGGTTDFGWLPPAPETSETGIDLDLLDIRPEDIRVEPGVITEPPPPPPAPTPPPTAPEPSPEVFIPPPVVEETRAVEPPVVPPIQVAPMSVAPERPATTRSRDVVLPRTVVAAWSLFVLMAQGLAFVAGLLAGHYLWKVH